MILGSTSTGKTDVALKLAKDFNGELVSCDSRQVYKGLDIGTGKLPTELKIENFKFKIEQGKGWWKIGGVRIWMYDVIDYKKQYTVYDYVKEANKVIDGILKRGKLPIIVGGTGLYLRALTQGLSNLTIPLDLKLRKDLEKLSLLQLQEKLQKLSSSKWEKMNSSDRQNPRRLIRYIEIALLSCIIAPVAGLISTKADILRIGLIAPRGILYKRIDERVISRIEQGMIDEAEKLHRKGLSFKRMKQLGLEYGILADFLEGKISNKEELIKVLQGKIHGYARRQETWFKKEKEVNWFNITKDGWAGKLEKMIRSWYYLGDDQAH